MNNNGKGGGCIAGILAFCFLGGNVFLFTGLKGVEDNPLAVLMVVFAICADVFVIGYLIKIISQSKSNNNSNNYNNEKTDNYQKPYSNPDVTNNKKYSAYYEPEVRSIYDENNLTNISPIKTIERETLEDDNKKADVKSIYQSLYNVLLALYYQKNPMSRIKLKNAIINKTNT